ncbi:DMT family transporter [Cochlodiniinecator piscidefendens]|uniref:DMT family transporter n=1 Tax=Cochlodiniinecator piscidefendens TaxID=2715756 RepID=UPI00140DAC36|nr:DMT family transporter [Cochlodiniinecator piscidefendens]
MERKTSVDTFGVIALVGFSLLSGFNQVVVKLVNDGMQPVFFAGLRSFGALFCIGLWMMIRRKSFRIAPNTIGPGIFTGALFTAEFFFLFLALDYSNVSRVTILYFSMPIWVALAAHFFLPGERMSSIKALGVALAFGGVALAISERASSDEISLWGDVFAILAAMFWAGIALSVRLTPLAKESPEMQMMWQAGVSALVLLIIAPWFGPFLRDFTLFHAAGFVYQVVVGMSFAFVIWFWLISIYPATSVASFAFLSPIAGVVLGWGVLGETIGWATVCAIVLVAIGISLINRPTPATELQSG